MRGVKPRSSGLLMRLSPGRRGVVPLGCTPAHSPQGCRTGDGVGGWGQVWGREAYNRFLCIKGENWGLKLKGEEIKYVLKRLNGWERIIYWG